MSVNPRATYAQHKKRNVTLFCCASNTKKNMFGGTCLDVAELKMVSLTAAPERGPLHGVRTEWEPTAVCTEDRPMQNSVPQTSMPPMPHGIPTTCNCAKVGAQHAPVRSVVTQQARRGCCCSNRNEMLLIPQQSHPRSIAMFANHVQQCRALFFRVGGRGLVPTFCGPPLLKRAPF